MLRVRRAAASGVLVALAITVGCGKKADPEPNVIVDPNPGAVPDPNLEPDADTRARNELIRRWNRIALAVCDYQSQFGDYPAGIMGPTNTLGLSWRVQLLPYLGHEELFKQFKLNEAWDSEHNKGLVAKMPRVFESPIKPAPSGKTYLRAFTGDAFVYSVSPSEKQPTVPPGRAARGQLLANIVVNGTRYTALAIEAAEPSEWTKPDDFPFHLKGAKPDQPAVPKLGGVFDGGFHVLSMCGEVLFLPTDTKHEDLRAFITAGNRDKSRPDITNLYAKNPPKPWQRVPTRVPAEFPDAAIREAAVRNYQAILRGLHAYASEHDNRAPGGIVGSLGGLSWRVQLLPFLGEEALYKQFNLDEAWDSEGNKALIDKMPKVFELPGKPTPKGHTFVRTPEGDNGLFAIRRPPTEDVPRFPREPLLRGGRIFVKPDDDYPQGDGQNVLLIEAGATPWTKPDVVAVKFARGLPKPPPLGGAFEGGVHAAMGDGRITFYQNGYPETHLMRMLTGSAMFIDPLADEDKILYSIPAPPGMFPLK
jgi:hypothetical protein